MAKKDDVRKKNAKELRKKFKEHLKKQEAKKVCGK